MFTPCFLLFYRAVAEEMQRSYHPETEREGRNVERDNYLLLEGISLIEGVSRGEKNGGCHLESVINVVQGLCYAATK